ncbi:MAG: hypothetical protein Q8P81_01415 [Nanoarchaeota archaeon]|nr:hypothetical protein [Nanoarchaeota archaeon]
MEEKHAPTYFCRNLREDEGAIGCRHYKPGSREDYCALESCIFPSESRSGLLNIHAAEIVSRFGETQRRELLRFEAIVTQQTRAETL